MIVNFNQKRSRRPIISHRSSINHYDQLNLTKILAQRDPFIQHLQRDPFIQNLQRHVHRVANIILDDHPYPRTSDEFHRRTFEIEKKVRNLNLSPNAQRFLNRLITDTGVSVVSIFIKKNSLTLLYYFPSHRSIFGKDLI
jgi:hypothetical protein